MPLLPSYKTGGDAIRASDTNRLTDAARMLFNLHGHGRLRPTIAHNSISIANEDKLTLRFQKANTVAHAWNIGSVDLNPFDVCMITLPIQVQDPYAAYTYTGQPYTAEPDYVSEQAVEVQVPNETSFGRFAIAASYIPPGRWGDVWVDGICLCKVARTYHYSTSNTGRRPDRADTVMGETYLELCDIGAAKVLWILDAPGGTMGATPAIVQLDHRNTSGVGVRSGYTLGTAEVLRFGPSSGVTITQVTPGVARIDKA